MGFNTALRHAEDRSRPLGRRLTSLANAIEKFDGLSFTGAFDQLHLATGSSHRRWTAEQIDLAVELIADARRSWSAFREEAENENRRVKWKRPYSPLRKVEIFPQWMERYFTEEMRKRWRMNSETPLWPLVSYTAQRRAAAIDD